MAPKDGPALFDLLRREQEAKARMAEEVAAPVEGDDAPPQVERPIRLAQSQAVAEEPGAHIHVDLSATTLIAISVLLVTVVAGSYWLGHTLGFRAGDKHARSSIQVAAKTTIDAAHQSMADGQSSSDVDDKARSEANGDRTWIVGYDYVVVQEFRRDRGQDAQTVVQFLMDHGIEAVRVTFASGAMQVIAAKGFLRKDAAQKEDADRYLKRIRDIGAKFRAAGGQYDLQGYYKTYTGDRW